MGMVSDLKKGSAFEVKGEVFRVTKKELVTVGTHSHTKIKVYAKPLFGGGEKIFTLAHNDKVEIVEASKKSATVISKAPDKVQIMDLHSYETFDAIIDENLSEEINEGDTILFVNYKGKVLVLDKLKS
jgi:translation initiation factor 5A